MLGCSFHGHWGFGLLTLYGTKKSRAFRCLWMLEEAGVDYELQNVDFAEGETRQSDHLRINPNGKVPVLVDGERTIVESLAINLHLARNHAPQLWPTGHFADSDTYQWLAWAMGELEGPHDAANRSGADIDPAALDTSLEFLRRRLAGQAYIHGAEFTVTDLNTAAVLLRPRLRAVVSSDAHIQDWFNTCVHRPALQRATAD